MCQLKIMFYLASRRTFKILNFTLFFSFFSVTANASNLNIHNDQWYEAFQGESQVFMSPNGDDSGDCDSIKKPCKTFQYAISNMSPGDGLILLDGDYPSKYHGELRIRDQNGNKLSNNGVNVSSISAQLPSGINFLKPTIIRAKNPGKVFIEGGITLGDNRNKAHHIVVYGLTFFTLGRLHNADNVVIKSCGFNSSISIGTQEHDKGCINNLIEDVWIWGSNSRSNATTYRSNHNTWRRILIRDDGCDVIHCGMGRGNASIATTVYNSNNVIMENVLTVDRILRANAMSENNTNYSDYATAQHTYLRYGEAFPTPGGEENGNNSWLGCMAINSEDYAINFEADHVLGTSEKVIPTIILKDFAALNTYGGISMDGARRAYSGVSKHIISGVHIRAREKPVFYRGCFTPDKSDTGCKVHEPVNAVDAGAITTGFYKGNHAKLLPQNKYFNGQLTTERLWPWPNESRIKYEICERGDFKGTGDKYPEEGIRKIKSLCTFSGTLSEYINSF